MQLEAELRHYGVPPNSLKALSPPAGPALVDYLDLVKPPSPGELVPDGVAESQGKPLLFYVSESKLATSADEQKQQLQRLRRRTLGCRGQRAYLAVVRHGRLEVVPVSLDERAPEWKTYKAGQGEAITFFSRLALGEYDGTGEPKHADFAFEAMFDLLSQAGEQLAGPHGLDKNDALSLIGRALFFRFLVDRQVVTEDRERPRIAPKAASLLDCFKNAENAAATSRWLDETFNGDFLQLSQGGTKAFFTEIGTKTNGGVFRHLQAIMLGWHAVGGSTYQIPLDWDVLDFAHVPVGLLSQVYEAFCWKWEPQTARETSVHYTPRNIAATLVEEVFDGLPNAHECRVLDPACGGGVFLVLAFRRLYRALWEHNREHGRDRPDTRAIRRILQNQLTGFDISESAIRLTALSLYLTGVELDPNPIPPEKLAFAPLRDNALFNFRRHGTDPSERPVIGCLGEHVPGKFSHTFDIVLSNPPWTGLPKKVTSIKDKEERQKEEKRLAALAKEFTEVSRAVIRSKGEEELAASYRNPDKGPDLPMLWKSTEWCKENGRIAMALPARILLKQEDVPKEARKTLLSLVEVTGIINGSNLADTRVWPTVSINPREQGKKPRAKMSQPFMLLFARNSRPKPGQTLQLITPLCDPALNGQGEVWIDSKSARPVEVDATFEEPWLWKTMAVGTGIEASIVRKIKGVSDSGLGAYWEGELELASGNGYQVAADQTQQDASFLVGLPNLDSTGLFRFQVDPSQLRPFDRDPPELVRPRNPEIYRSPLVLVKVSPGKRREDGRALLAFTDIAYNESFHGYSAARHAEGELLVRFIHLFVHSNVSVFYALATSPEFGAERRKLQKGDLDHCPVVPLSLLSSDQKREIMRLSKRLVDGRDVFREIDEFFAALYGLDRLDLEVIGDTLDVCLPYSNARKRACQHPTHRGQETFRGRLEELLRPFFKVVGQKPVVRLWGPPDARVRQTMPYGVLVIGEGCQGLPEADEFFRERVAALATETGQTLIVQESQDGLLVAILNQYRYWTPSRARLLAAEIVRNHMSPFGG